MKWNKITEELPKDDTFVVVLCEDIYRRYIPTIRYYSKHMFHGNYQTYVKDTYDYWSELPEFPDIDIIKDKNDTKQPYEFIRVDYL